jgi:hypothetical protein
MYRYFYDTQGRIQITHRFNSRTQSMIPAQVDHMEYVDSETYYHMDQYQVDPNTQEILPKI